MSAEGPEVSGFQTAVIEPMSIAIVAAGVVLKIFSVVVDKFLGK